MPIQAFGITWIRQIDLSSQIVGWLRVSLTETKYMESKEC